MCEWRKCIHKAIFFSCNCREKCFSLVEDKWENKYQFYSTSLSVAWWISVWQNNQDMMRFVITRKDNEEDTSVHRSDCKCSMATANVKSLKILNDNIIFNMVHVRQIRSKQWEFTWTELSSQLKSHRTAIFTLITEWINSPKEGKSGRWESGRERTETEQADLGQAGSLTGVCKWMLRSWASVHKDLQSPFRALLA